MNKRDKFCQRYVQNSGVVCTCGWNNGDHDLHCDMEYVWDEAVGQWEDKQLAEQDQS